MDCLLNCHFKRRDECQSRCLSDYLLVHQFFLRSVCQAASSDGEMDVNQDVHHIVYNDPHMKKKNISLSV